MTIHRKSQPYRMRLRAAFKALCWWKPWYDWYGFQVDLMHEFEEGYTKGLTDGRCDVCVTGRQWLPPDFKLSVGDES